MERVVYDFIEINFTAKAIFIANIVMTYELSNIKAFTNVNTSVIQLPKLVLQNGCSNRKKAFKLPFDGCEH